MESSMNCICASEFLFLCELAIRPIDELTMVRVRSNPLLNKKGDGEKQNGQQRNEKQANLSVADVRLCFFGASGRFSLSHYGATLMFRQVLDKVATN